MKKIKNDLILIGVVIIISIVSIVIMLLCKKTDNLTAVIYHGDEIVLTINLEDNVGEHEYIVTGDVGDVHILCKDKSIAIIESSCSNQTCVHQGFISSSSQSICCLPNRISIKLISAYSNVDVEV